MIELKTPCTSEDIEKLKLSINEKQLLITMYRKIQKPEEV